MQAAIANWLRSTVPTVSAERLMDDVPGCERWTTFLGANDSYERMVSIRYHRR
jgi:hypothetical protein